MAAGGVELVFAMLSARFVARGCRVTLVLDMAEGPNLVNVPPEVRIVDLKAPRLRIALLRLACFLRRERPDVLLSAMDLTNVVAVLAAMLAGYPGRVVVSIRNLWSIRLARAKSWQERSLRWLGSWAHRRAAAVITVSDQVSDDFVSAARVPRDQIVRIYNPVLPDILRRALEPVEHPFFAPGSPPVILGIGRLVEQKDFHTLLHAFSILTRGGVAARLIILGEGPLRGELTALTEQLGVASEVSLPGFTPNPYAYLRRSAVFALSSRWEAFGVVLIEALACGTPVVSTECPGGPAEILEGGRYGELVPAGDAAAMAAAIARVLRRPPNTASLEARASEFDLESTATAYLEVLLPETARVMQGQPAVA